MSLFHMLHAAQLMKSNPYHDANGHFASANGSGGGGGTKAHAEVKVEHKGKNYTVHHDEDGKPHKITGHYSDGNYKVWSKDSPKTSPLMATIMGKVGPAVAVQSVATGAALATQVKPQDGDVKSLGKIHEAQAYTVQHNGKTYYASYTKEGGSLPQKIAEYKPGDPDAKVLYKQGKSAPGLDASEEAAVKEVHKKAWPEHKAAMAAAPSSSHAIDEEKPAKTSLVETKAGDHIGVHKSTLPVSDEDKTKFEGFEGQNLSTRQGLLEEYGQKQRASWSKAEKEAVSSYQGSGYHEMNDYLRGNNGLKASSTTVAQVKAVQSAMDKSTIPFSATMYRGMRSDITDVLGTKDPDSLVGHAFLHKNFASTTHDESVANSFAHTYGSSPKTLMKFDVHPGQKGLVMPYQGESEVVLPSNSVFRVDKIQKLNESTHLIHATYMGEKETSKMTKTDPKEVKKTNNEDKAAASKGHAFDGEASDFEYLGEVVHDGTED